MKEAKEENVNVGKELLQLTADMGNVTKDYRTMVGKEYGVNPSPEHVKKIFTKGLRKLKKSLQQTHNTVTRCLSMVDALLEVYK